MDEVNDCVPPTEIPDPAWLSPAEPPPTEIKITREDWLESENLHLRSMLAAQEVKNLELVVSAKVKEHAELTAKILAARVALERRYGINLATHYIRETDLVVVPRPPTNPLLAQAISGIIGPGMKVVA